MVLMVLMVLMLVVISTSCQLHDRSAEINCCVAATSTNIPEVTSSSLAPPSLQVGKKADTGCVIVQLLLMDALKLTLPRVLPLLSLLIEGEYLLQVAVVEQSPLGLLAE